MENKKGSKILKLVYQAFNGLEFYSLFILAITELIKN